MPTYEYRCQDCSHEFELVQRMSDDPLSLCPECGGNVKRLIGKGAGIIFKGSGFYQTDYRSDSYHKEAAKEKPDSSSGGSDKKTTPAAPATSTSTSTSTSTTTSSSTTPKSAD